MTPATTPPLPADFLAKAATFAQSLPGGDTAFTIVLFILLLSLLVFVHELGHYLAARRVGIKVLAFSIGFGRALISWTDKNNTRWKIGWLPLGGYVQMLGQEDLKASTQSAQKGHYMSKSVYQRAFVIVAGPLANLLLGVALLWGAFSLGEQKLKAEVGALVPAMPAAAVLQVGDVVTHVANQPVAGWEELLDVISHSPAEPLALSLERAGQPLQVTLTPQIQAHTDVFGETHTVGRIGVAPSGTTYTIARNPIEAFSRAVERGTELTGLTMKSLWKLLTGAMSADNLTGPLGIANLTGQTAHSGFYALLILGALISINLGVVNLVPLPVLDGGHLVLLLLEKLRGKPLGAQAQEWAFRAGLACIIGLAVLSTFQDLRRLGVVPASQGAAQGQPATPSSTIAQP